MVQTNADALRHTPEGVEEVMCLRERYGSAELMAKPE